MPDYHDQGRLPPQGRLRQPSPAAIPSICSPIFFFFFFFFRKSATFFRKSLISCFMLFLMQERPSHPRWLHKRETTCMTEIRAIQSVVRYLFVLVSTPNPKSILRIPYQMFKFDTCVSLLTDCLIKKSCFFVYK